MIVLNIIESNDIIIMVEYIMENGNWRDRYKFRANTPPMLLKPEPACCFHPLFFFFKYSLTSSIIIQDKSMKSRKFYLIELPW